MIMNNVFIIPMDRNSFNGVYNMKCKDCHRLFIDKIKHKHFQSAEKYVMLKAEITIAICWY